MLVEKPNKIYIIMFILKYFTIIYFKSYSDVCVPNRIIFIRFRTLWKYLSGIILTSHLIPRLVIIFTFKLFIFFNKFVPIQNTLFGLQIYASSISKWKLVKLLCFSIAIPFRYVFCSSFHKPPYKL